MLLEAISSTEGWKAAKVLMLLTISCFAAGISAQESTQLKQRRPVNPLALREPLDHGGLQMGLARRKGDVPWVAYTVTVSGNGEVQFIGGMGMGMLTPGHHRDYISSQAVDEILTTFRRANYFALKDQYRYPITDAQGTRTWIQIDGQKKSVDDYAGTLAGAPAALGELEQSFERIAKTEKWIRGNKDTLPSLLSEHWDFQSQSESNLGLYANAMANGPDELIDFILRQPRFASELLSRALQGATSKGKVSLARRLIERGANPRPAPSLYKRTLLMTAVGSGHVEMVREILRYRQDVNATDSGGQTALGSLFNFWFRESATVEILKTLIAVGADVNRANNIGTSPISQVCGGSPELVRLLKRAGANLNVRDLNGETPLMSCWDVSSVQALIDAGANLKARNGKGLTARQLAWEHGMMQKAELLESAEKSR
jgi:hypothetical protein